MSVVVKSDILIWSPKPEIIASLETGTMIESIEIPTLNSGS